MSTHEEIMAVFEQDINDKVKVVYNKQGSRPFYDGYDGFSVIEPFAGLGIEDIVCSDFKPRNKDAAQKRKI